MQILSKQKRRQSLHPPSLRASSAAPATVVSHSCEPFSEVAYEVQGRVGSSKGNCARGFFCLVSVVGREIAYFKPCDLHSFLFHCKELASFDCVLGFDLLLESAQAVCSVIAPLLPVFNF